MAKDVFTFGLSGSALKVIAILSMVSDHVAYFFVQHDTELYEVMRCFGRIAFPVFAFLIAEGFAHTRNRQRYFFTLLVFAAISEVPWLLLNGYGGGHNVMFTLALGVLALQVLNNVNKQRIFTFVLIAMLAYIAERYNLDYGWRGIAMIVIFYIFRPTNHLLTRAVESKNNSLLNIYFFLPLLQVLFAFPLMMHYGVIGAILASLAILFYNEQRGFIKGKVAKYAFYAFYPAHLFVIWLFTL